MLRKKTLVLLSFTLVLCFETAKADQFVITQGSTTITGLGPAVFSSTISGSGFLFSGNVWSLLPGTPLNGCLPCPPGSLVSLSIGSGSLDSSDFFPSVFFIDGVSYPISTIAVMNMGFTTNSVPVPLAGDLVSVTAPFLFGAHFASGDSGSFIAANLSGSGTAEMVLQLGGDGLYRRQSITYTFQTPEPMTILLLGTGVLILARFKNRFKVAR